MNNEFRHAIFRTNLSFGLWQTGDLIPINIYNTQNIIFYCKNGMRPVSTKNLVTKKTWQT